jgi:arabinose-5-phosphate isomerase
MTPWQVGKETIKKELQALQVFYQGMADEYFRAAVELILAAEKRGGRVHVTGVGKPRHVGKKITATLQSTGTKAYFLDPTDCVHGDSGSVAPHDVVIAISHSGKTRELLAAVETIKPNGASLIAIVGDRESELAKRANVVLHVPVPEEAGPLGLAPTSSTTCQLAVGDGLAMALEEARGFTEEEFKKYHPGGSLGTLLEHL